jgi:hypothetical protein
MPKTLTDRIAQAIGDPGSIVGRKHGPSWGEGNDGYAEHEETVTRWSTRAVVAVLVESMALEPCHITGMHSPEHHVRYTCAGAGCEIDPAARPRSARAAGTVVVWQTTAWRLATGGRGLAAHD